MEFVDVEYMPKPNYVKTHITSSLPPGLSLANLGAAYTFTFNGADTSHPSVLLTNLKLRGWDLPGGKLEECDLEIEKEQEGAEDMMSEEAKILKVGENCAIRETLEETQVVVKDLHLVGLRYYHTDGEKTEKASKFPFPDCFFLFFFALSDQVLPFDEEPQENGAQDRKFWDFEEVRDLKVYKNHPALFDSALAVFKENYMK
eukprot:CAMPEP_0174257588 /NCGR_PEP_ID=MMETSP0439-20130205/6709_1 /TAXON_ID=0 /ORGANISM="Stereomyxa ramosa, Strain Chinc5" /LENGTH=201 /DNA_ID=CAMNT_0015340743 /DNA_START=45 /DNA_END=650 /DNA_ORIENTATION=+